MQFGDVVVNTTMTKGHPRRFSIITNAVTIQCTDGNGDHWTAFRSNLTVIGSVYEPGELAFYKDRYKGK